MNSLRPVKALTAYPRSLFNFQPDNTGSHVSKWIALYWCLTAALTATVLVARTLLFRNKFNLKPDTIDRMLQVTSELVNMDDDDEEMKLDEIF